MKNNKAKYVIAIMLLNLLSCSFLNTEVVEISPQKSKIAVFCEILNDEKWTQTIVLSRTRNIGQTFSWDFGGGDTLFVGGNGAIINTCFIANRCLEFDTVRGAKIKLLSNNIQVANFIQTDPYFKAFYSADSVRLKDGNKCQLQVSAPDFDTIFSEQSVPKTVKLVSAKFRRNSFQAPKSGLLNELVLEFDNDPSITNYYAVDIYIKKLTQNDYFYQRPNLVKIDPNSDTPQFISSKNFKANRYTWRIGVDLGIEASKPIPNDFLNMTIMFRSTSKDFNEYAKNLEVTKNAGDNLFGEPITPYTNIKNGYGVFVVSGKPDTLSIPIR